MEVSNTSLTVRWQEVLYIKDLILEIYIFLRDYTSTQDGNIVFDALKGCVVASDFILATTSTLQCANRRIDYVMCLPQVRGSHETGDTHLVSL